MKATITTPRGLVTVEGTPVELYEILFVKTEHHTSIATDRVARIIRNVTTPMKKSRYLAPWTKEDNTIVDHIDFTKHQYKIQAFKATARVLRRSPAAVERQWYERQHGKNTPILGLPL